MTGWGLITSTSGCSIATTPNVEVAAIVNWANAHISERRIGVLGASNWSLDRIEAANQYATANNLQGISLLSNHFGLATQQAPRWPGARNGDPADRARLAGLAVPNLAWSAQCGGFFASTDNPTTVDREFAAAYAHPDNFARRDRARQLAGEMGLAPTQVALAYTLNQDFESLRVFWAADRFELEQSLEASAVTLTPQQLDFLESG